VQQFVPRHSDEFCPLQHRVKIFCIVLFNRKAKKILWLIFKHYIFSHISVETNERLKPSCFCRSTCYSRRIELSEGKLNPLQL
jgi:hypothetical protein